MLHHHSSQNESNLMLKKTKHLFECEDQSWQAITAVSTRWVISIHVAMQVSALFGNKTQQSAVSRVLLFLISFKAVASKDRRVLTCKPFMDTSQS